MFKNLAAIEAVVADRGRLCVGCESSYDGGATSLQASCDVVVHRATFQGRIIAGSCKTSGTTSRATL